MSDLATTAAAWGEDERALWLKISTALQSWAGVTSDGSIARSQATLNQPQENMLRAAYALQSQV